MSTSTRERLVEAANRAFAEHGILGASLVEVTRQAGQRNRGAVHYHFGGRDELLAAVLEQHVDFLAKREGELLALAHHPARRRCRVGRGGGGPPVHGARGERRERSQLRRDRR